MDHQSTSMIYWAISGTQIALLELAELKEQARKDNKDVCFSARLRVTSTSAWAPRTDPRPGRR